MSSDHDISSIQDHIRVYLMVFGALAVLTIVTVLASYLEISRLFYAPNLRKKYDHMDPALNRHFLFCDAVFTTNLIY